MKVKSIIETFHASSLSNKRVMKNILRNDRRSNIFDRMQLKVDLKGCGNKNILIDELITPPSLRRARWSKRTAIGSKCMGSDTLIGSLNHTWSKIKSTSRSYLSKKGLIDWEILKVSDDNDIGTMDQDITSKELISSRNDLIATNQVHNSTLLDNTSIFDTSVGQLVKHSSILSNKIVTRSIYKKLLSSNLNLSPSITLSTNTKTQSKLKETINNLERIFSPRRLRSRNAVSQPKPNPNEILAGVPHSKIQVTAEQVSRNKRKKCDSKELSAILPVQKRIKVPCKHNNEPNKNDIILRKSHRLIELANDKAKVAVVKLTHLPSSCKAIKKVSKEVLKTPLQTKETVSKNVKCATDNLEAEKSKFLRDKEKIIINFDEVGKKLTSDSKGKVSKQKSKKLRKEPPEIAHKKKALEDEHINGKKIQFPVAARKGTLKYKKAFRHYLNEISKEDDDQDYLATPFRNNTFKLGGLNINKMSLYDDDNFNLTPRSECSMPSPATFTATPLFRSYFSPAINIPAKRIIADTFNLNLKRRAKPKIKKTIIKKNKKVRENLDKIINKQVKAIIRDEESKAFIVDDDDNQEFINEDTH